MKASLSPVSLKLLSSTLLNSLLGKWFWASISLRIQSQTARQQVKALSLQSWWTEISLQNPHSDWVVREENWLWSCPQTSASMLWYVCIHTPQQQHKHTETHNNNKVGFFCLLVCLFYKESNSFWYSLSSSCVVVPISMATDSSAF